MNFTNITSFNGSITEIPDTSWNISAPSQSSEKTFSALHNYYNHHDQIDYITFNKFINTSSHFLYPEFLNTSLFDFIRLGVSVLGIICNISVLVANLVNGRNKHGILKIRLLVLFLILVMTITCILMTVIFVFDCLTNVYVDLQKLWSESQNQDEISFLWRNLADFLLQPMFDLQSIMMMYIALDRYASLFVGYWPFVENRKRLAYFLIAPLIFAFILMSPGIQHFVLPFESFIYARLALLLLPSAISFLLLSVCLVIKKERLNYDPGFSISLSKALVRVLYVFVIIDFISRLFLFFRLAEDNIDFVVLTGSENGDFVLHTFLNIGLQVSICVYYLAPVYIPIALSLFVKHFRDSICCCQRLNKVHII
ncbi:hypothetical protein GCK72_024203 [Caenorhabditis remanei]|uniref:Uncharacterized protein n=1 Tax=Caenorhabditis remanei TaxID=31234 RepID=A0A6A5FYR8_CAERE|nr:hypothetical protein GCK72_024203 [Caenorhabditis remanei]KAF1747737.1 hypothetical protein GCK72_024203 [Caenorhabditis remanei]